MSKFKITLDEFKEGDYKIEFDRIPIFFDCDVKKHINRLYITYEQGKLTLNDSGLN
ncbi:hypothetical protein [Evansella tamaricis]|uniref:Uncharacterized protein n=1 Tax=Evansella tamaricis TaxID=2069301 RepID=A0ABS6JM66_9BACI|nr:hypothetical protein [Evansella tamaricis]MBU9713408.1 hypothetical protein [Evansella tamaricis]